MKRVLSFDYLVTPKILVFLYWLLMVLILVIGIFSVFQGQILAGIATIILGMINCRVVFELIMIAFKNNEYLRRIAESCDKAE